MHVRFSLLLILVLTQFGHAQGLKSDSLIAAMVSNPTGDSAEVRAGILIAETLIAEGNFNDALFQAQQAKILATNIADRRGLALSSLWIGIAHYRLGAFLQAEHPLKDAIIFFKENGVRKELALALHWLGNVNYATSRYNEALENYLESFAIREAMNDVRGMGFSLNNIGNVYNDQGQYEKALEFQFRSLDLKKTLGDKRSIATSYNNIAALYLGLRRFDEALSYCYSALEIFRAINDQRGIALTLGNTGEIFEKRGEYAKALTNLLEATQLLEQQGDRKSLAEAYNHLGIIYTTLRKFDAAESSLLKAQQNAELANSAYEQTQNLKNFARLDSARGNMTAAYNRMWQYMDFYQKVFNAEKSKQIAEMQTMHETQQKEKTIALLTKENEIQQAKELNQRIIFAGALAFLVIVSGGLFYFLRQKQRANTVLETQKRQLQELNQLKDKLFSVVAHDLKSPLQNLNGVLTLADRSQVTEQELKMLLGTIGENTQYTIELVDNLLTWSKDNLSGNTVVPERVNLFDVAEANAKLLSRQAIQKNIAIVNAIDPGVFLRCDRDMLDIVLRNLMSNAIKFTHSHGVVTLRASVNDAFATIEVKDTGVGIDNHQMQQLFAYATVSTRGTSNEKGTGLGLVVCKEFVEKNNGKIWAESIQHKGTSFFIQLPLAPAPAPSSVFSSST